MAAGLRYPPAPVAAVWCALLWDGMMLADRQVSRAQPILDEWGCGSVTLMQALAERLPALWASFTPEWQARIRANPGDDEFQVLFELGEHLGYYIRCSHGRLYCPRVTAMMGRELMSRYLPDALAS